MKYLSKIKIDYFLATLILQIYLLIVKINNSAVTQAIYRLKLQHWCRRIMQEEQLLENFIRLVDYMCSEALITRVISNVDDVLRQLQFSRDVPADKIAKGTFVSYISFLDSGMSFSPPETLVRDVLHSNAIEGQLLQE